MSRCNRSDVSIREVKTVRLRILSGINKADIHMKEDQWNSGTVEQWNSGTVEEWKSVWTGSDFDLSVLKRAAGREVMFLFIVPQSVQVFWTLLSVRITINLN